MPSKQVTALRVSLTPGYYQLCIHYWRTPARGSRESSARGTILGWPHPEVCRISTRNSSCLAKDIRGSTQQSDRSAKPPQRSMTTYEHVPAVGLLAGSRLVAGRHRREVEGRRLEGSLLGRHFGEESGGETRVGSSQGQGSCYALTSRFS